VVSRAALPEAPSRACNGSFVVRQQIILKCMNADMIYGVGYGCLKAGIIMDTSKSWL
jgi:hypothetical protein